MWTLETVRNSYLAHGIGRLLLHGHPKPQHLALHAILGAVERRLSLVRHPDTRVKQGGYEWRSLSVWKGGKPCDVQLHEYPTCVFIALCDLIVLLPLTQEAANKQTVEAVQDLVWGVRVSKWSSLALGSHGRGHESSGTGRLKSWRTGSGSSGIGGCQQHAPHCNSWLEQQAGMGHSPRQNIAAYIICYQHWFRIDSITSDYYWIFTYKYG